MQKLIWTITAIGLLATAASANAAASKEETIGVGAGGVIGAVAGGPLGFMIGAAIGAKVGDTLYKKDSEIETLSGSLNDTRETVGVLQSDLRKQNSDANKLGNELQELRQIARPELVDLMQAGIAMDLLFRTDEHVLADTTGGRLAEMAVTLASMPDIQVQLDGFADERGDSKYNQQLSEKRVEFVRELLLAAGVESSRIGVAAHGEAPAQDDNVDSFALERRVSMTLFIDNSPSFASNPE
jgi:outer membrane protein OmpA-like peptidoglycan-associated protein